MRLDIPVIPRQRMVRSLIKYGNLHEENGIYSDIQGYIKDKFGVSNVYDIINPYEVRRAIIDAGDKTEGVKHFLVLDESGYIWEDEYSDDVAKEIQAKVIVDIGDAQFTADEQKDIESSAESILFKDFGYDEYFEHLDLSIFHKVKSSNSQATYKLFYRVFEEIFSDLFLNVKDANIDDDRLTIYLSHLIITYMTEWRLEDIIEYEYEIDKSKYNTLRNSNISTYLITLFHEFDTDVFTDEMKYTVAVIIYVGCVFVKNGFMRIKLDK